MSMLEVSLLGTFQVIQNSAAIASFRSVNTQGLFAYLLLQSERPFSRDTLATLFWPDEPDSTAKKNLRQTLYQLRQALGDSDDQPNPFLTITRQSIQWNPNSDFKLDVQQFLDDLQRGELATAVAHYQGELLPGFTCDSLEFEAWLRQERERLHRLALTALADLTERHFTQSDYSAAAASARRQLSLEPWRESAHRQLMRALALLGDRSAALAQLAICQQVLNNELGAAPSRETLNLAAQIEAGAFGRDEATLIAGQYELGAQIGQGAMGSVYRGRHSLTGQAVAIKMLDGSRTANSPELLARFRREGEALRQLAHPHIVQLLATDSRDDNHYLVMELIDGGNLLQRLQTQPQPPLQQALSIALDLSDALIHAHRWHILHRDIKPANVLLDSNGRPRLTDFGIARLGQDSTLTQQGAVLGTVAYLSPEGCRGELLDERADIWSFGLLLYEMLAGERPFAQPTAAATLMAILQEPTPDIQAVRPDLPPALVHLLTLMLQKEREQRIGSMRQVGAALEAILQAVQDGTVAMLHLDLPTPPPTATAVTPFQAPPTPPHFVGRAAVLADLEQALTHHPIVALVGMGGIGKTSLATAVAHHLRPHFADGVLWANPHTSQPSNILQLWGTAYDHDFSGLTDLASRETAVRTLLAHKQSLLVLDNVEEAATARPLLLHGAQGATLLTTRNLDVAAALNAHVVAVPELSAESSRALLAQILGEARLLATPQETAAADQIGALLHYLPLAVEIAAQRLKSRSRMTLAALAQRLQDEQQRLGLAISDSAVRASFAVSWQALNAPLQTLFAQIGAFGGRPFTAEALAAVANRDVYDAEDDLYTLVALSLVQEVGETRYTQHPLLADFAAEKLGNDTAVVDRLIDYYLGYAQAHAETLTALEPEWDNLLAAVQAAHRQQAWQAVLDLTTALGTSWFRYGRYHDANTAYALAETAAQKLDSDELLADTLLRWAEVAIEQSAYDGAWQKLETAVAHYHRLENGRGLAQSTYFQGCILFDQGLYEDAEAQLQQSIRLAREIEDKDVEANATEQLANVYFNLDETTNRSEQTALDALTLHLANQNEVGQIQVHKLLANVEIRNGDLDAAERHANQALSLSERIENPVQKGLAYYQLVGVLSLREQYDSADELAQKALHIFRHRGNRRYEAMILHELSLNHLALGQPEQSMTITAQTRQIYRQIEDRVGYAYATRHLGDIYQQMEQPDPGRAAWLEAKQIAEYLNHSHLLAGLQKRLGY